MGQLSQFQVSKLVKRIICGLTLSLMAISLLANSVSHAQKNNRQKPKPDPTSLPTLGPPPPIPTLLKKPAPPEKEPEISVGDVISVETSEVMIPVTVRDPSGRLVSDLKRTDFRVFEDGSAQPLSDLELRQVPVDVALMVDASSSVASKLDDFRKAAEGFAARLAVDDRLSLIKFDDRVELLLDWTKSRFQLHRALNRRFADRP